MNSETALLCWLIFQSTYSPSCAQLREYNRASSTHSCSCLEISDCVTAVSHIGHKLTGSQLLASSVLALFVQAECTQNFEVLTLSWAELQFRNISLCREPAGLGTDSPEPDRQWVEGTRDFFRLEPMLARWGVLSNLRPTFRGEEAEQNELDDYFLIRARLLLIFTTIVFLSGSATLSIALASSFLFSVRISFNQYSLISWSVYSLMSWLLSPALTRFYLYSGCCQRHLARPRCSEYRQVGAGVSSRPV